MNQFETVVSVSEGRQLEGFFLDNFIVVCLFHSIEIVDEGDEPGEKSFDFFHYFARLAGTKYLCALVLVVVAVVDQVPEKPELEGEFIS